VGLGPSGFLHLPSIVCCGPSAAWAVSNYGQRVFGNSDAGNGRTHPTIWTVHPGGPIGTLIATSRDLDPTTTWDGYVNDRNQLGTTAVGTEVNTRGTPGA